MKELTSVREIPRKSGSLENRSWCAIKAILVLARLMREVKTSRGSSAAHCDTHAGAQECNPCCLVQNMQELVGNNNDLPNTVGKPIETSLRHIKLQIPSVCSALK